MIVGYRLLSIVPRLGVNDHYITGHHAFVGEPECVDDFSSYLIAFKTCANEHEIADIDISQDMKYEPFMVGVTVVQHKSNLYLHLKRSLATTVPTTNVAPTTSAIHPVGWVDHSDGR